MTLQSINPKDLPIPQTYSQVVVATGSKLVFVSGQEPEDIHGKLVGDGDLAAQARPHATRRVDRGICKRLRTAPVPSGRED